MFGDVKSILPQIEKLKSEGKKIISTNGCFDLLHRGHVSYLAAAKKLGDVLVVGINSDKGVKKLKGEGRPVNKAQDRAFVLSALKSVDIVFIFDEDTPVEFLQILKPHVHAKGGDYKAENLPEYPILRAMGSDVSIISFVDGYSTTQILSKRS